MTTYSLLPPLAPCDLAGCAPGHGSHEPTAYSGYRRRSRTLPGDAPRCDWYSGQRSGGSCTCQPCAPGTWSKGGRLSAAACEPVSNQSLALSVVLEGSCAAYGPAGDALVTQLRSSMAPYPGVARSGASITSVSKTSGTYSGKVRHAAGVFLM